MCIIYKCQKQNVAQGLQDGRTASAGIEASLLFECIEAKIFFFYMRSPRRCRRRRRTHRKASPLAGMTLWVYGGEVS